MEEGNRLPLGANARRFVDEANAGGATALEGSAEVVDEEADVMDAGPASLHEAVDGGARLPGLEKLDQRLARPVAGDRGAVRIVEGYFGEAEDVAIKVMELVEGANGNAHVGDARGTTRFGRHGNGGCSVAVEVGADVRSAGNLMV
jgi:hypothetical protein